MVLVPWRMPLKESTVAYREVPAKIDLPAMEHEVLQFWADKDVFHESLKKTADGPLWVFYEGPPTANG